ncbi:hypothetical protein MRX96_021804 [Rhipicephalus microplus]
MKLLTSKTGKTLSPARLLAHAVMDAGKVAISGASVEDEDECLTCNVCERPFPSARRLSQHQQRKRHFGCPVCEALFPSLSALEEHKETLEHWSDDEERQLSRSKAPAKRQHRGDRGCDAILIDEDDLDDEDDDDEDEESSDEDTDSDDLDSGPKTQELERLL